MADVATRIEADIRERARKVVVIRNAIFEWSGQYVPIPVALEIIERLAAAPAVREEGSQDDVR